MATATTQNSSGASASADDKISNLQLYKEAKDLITKLASVMDEQEQACLDNRTLRYAEVDIEAERKAARIGADELYIPQHIIDTNIRREQPLFISYLTASARTVIFSDDETPAANCTVIERDFTRRTRYDGWQFPLFRAVDGMQQNGYSIIELVADTSKPGHMILQDVAYGDFGYSLDSKSIQSCEMLTRRYHLTKTQLLAMCDPKTFGFNLAQVKKVIGYKKSPNEDGKHQSLYCVEKVMFRVGGFVMVAWASHIAGDDWLRAPKYLSIGRKEQNVMGEWVDAKETQYPYFLVPYTISENTKIREYHGRVYLDQDYQEGASSLMSSFVTAHRRGSYLMFSKESDFDPNADVVTQSNVIPKSGAVINSKVKQFQLAAPDSSMLNAIQSLVSANQQENSQINYAAQNRQDSRKTATEIQAATQSSQQLSTVQLALFSSSIKAIYQTFFEVVRSRIMAGAINDVTAEVKEFYARQYTLKPAGDVDVVERQQKVQSMMGAWGVLQATPAADLFLKKYIQMQFPDDAAEYITALDRGNAQQAALMGCLNVFNALVSDPSALSPEGAQELPLIKQLIQQITAVLQPKEQNAGQTPQPPR